MFEHGQALKASSVLRGRPSPQPVHTGRGLTGFTMDRSVVVVTLVDPVDKSASLQVSGLSTPLRGCGGHGDGRAASSTGQRFRDRPSTVVPRLSLLDPRLVHRVVHRCGLRCPQPCPQRVDNCGELFRGSDGGSDRPVVGGEETAAPWTADPSGAARRTGPGGGVRADQAARAQAAWEASGGRSRRRGPHGGRPG